MSQLVRTEPVVVFVHVHYADVWADLARLLAERMVFDFRLVITSSLPVEGLARLHSPHLLETTVIATENRGRDIRPFLLALHQVDRYSIGLKLHTKRSSHLQNGNEWRKELFDSLVPPDAGPAAIHNKMVKNPQIGLVAPKGSLLSIKDWLMANRLAMEEASKLLALQTDRSALSSGLFAAGSMFWFRRDAFSSFAASGDLLTRFEDEAGQVDGTMGHALERLFALAVEQNGYVALSAPALAEIEPAMTLPDMLRVSRAHAASEPFFLMPPAPMRLLQRFPLALALYGRLPDRIRAPLRKMRAAVRRASGADLTR